jgi:titin
VAYDYRVQAVNRFGASTFSNIATGGPVSVVPPVPYLNARTSGPGTIFLQWDLPFSTPPIPVTGYSLWRKGGGADWAPIAALPANIKNYIDTGLRPNTQYTYRVRAFNGTAASLDWSREASATTPLVPPTAPTGLAANVVSTTRVDLRWALQTSDETAVEVWRKTGTGAFVAIAFLPPGSTSYSDTSVTSGAAYTYQVRAANDIFVSPWSNGVSATTP